MRLQRPVRVATLLELSLVKLNEHKYKQTADRFTYSVVEVSRRDSFLYTADIVCIRIALNDDFNTFTKPSQLIPNVSCPTETLELQELLVAELLRIIRVGPLLPNIEQREVISTRTNEILTSLVCMHFLVFRAIE